MRESLSLFLKERKAKREKVARMKRTQNICVIIGPAQRVREPSLSLFQVFGFLSAGLLFLFVIFTQPFFSSFPTSFHHPRLLYVSLRHWLCSLAGASNNGSKSAASRLLFYLYIFCTLEERGKKKLSKFSSLQEKKKKKLLMTSGKI